MTEAAGIVRAYPPTVGVDVEFDPNDPYGIVDGKATRWVTKDKRCLLITSMTDGHIINTINFIERKRTERRNLESDAWAMLGSFSPDSMASYYGSQAVDDISQEVLVFMMATDLMLAGLRAEAKRRGLAEVLVPFKDPR